MTELQLVMPSGLVYKFDLAKAFPMRDRQLPRYCTPGTGWAVALGLVGSQWKDFSIDLESSVG